jgi:histidyl-tRNA synthetase
VERLRTYYAAHEAELCGDCRRRLQVNPLRLLDCKVPSCQPIADAAPGFVENLCDTCREHFDEVRAALAREGIPTALNQRLVRGFDYYTRTVFEVWPPSAGAQASIGGGGRYDGLAEQLGGRHTPGVGFGTGIERLILNLRQQGVEVDNQARPAVYVAHLSEPARAAAANFARALRAHGIPTLVGVGTRSLRARLRNADAAGARWAAFFGDDEVRDGTVSLRDLAAATPETLPTTTALTRVAAAVSEATL